jgi:hypothetical protein
MVLAAEPGAEQGDSKFLGLGDLLKGETPHQMLAPVRKRSISAVTDWSAWYGLTDS